MLYVQYVFANTYSCSCNDSIHVFNFANSGVDLISNPTKAATPQYGFRIAVWFWNTRGLSSYADQGTQSAFDTYVDIVTL